MTKIVIGLNGKAGAGKSTAAKVLQDRFRFVNVPFAGPLKRMAIAAGWSAREVYGDMKESPIKPDDRFARLLPDAVERNMLAALPESMRGKARPTSLRAWWQRHHRDFTSSRRFQQLIGTEWGREMVAPDFWIRCWKAEVGDHAATHFGPLMVCSDDCRFENEFAAIRGEGGIVVRIEREGAGASTGAAHVSENGRGVPDITIENNGPVDVLAARMSGILDRYFSPEAI